MVRRGGWLLALLALLIAAPPWADTPPNGQHSQPPPAWERHWQFRPQPPTNARGLPSRPAWPGAPGAPVWGGPPPWAGAPTSTRRGTAPAAPRLEVTLAQPRPYLQQQQIVRLRLIGDGRLATATPRLPSAAEVLFEPLAGPVNSLREAADGARHETVTDYWFVLTPLRVGERHIAWPEITGSDARGQPFTAQAPAGRLQVRSPPEAPRPWLPLRALSLEARLEGDDGRAGDAPLTLILEQRAEGGGGNLLPSFEPLLRAAGLRVYREATRIDTLLSADGQDLLGWRQERYTLLPDTAGQTRLPELRIAWWNLNTERAEVAILPMRTFGGGQSPERSWRREVWLPLAGLGLLLLGYWVGVGMQARQPTGRSGAPALPPAVWKTVARLSLSRFGERARAFGARAARRLSFWTRRVKLAQRIARHASLWRAALGARAWRLLPAPARLWYGTRMAGRAEDPATWWRLFCQQAGWRLPPDPARAARSLLQCCPRCDAVALERLLRQLDAAQYGRAPLDFARWRRDVRRALRPGADPRAWFGSAWRLAPVRGGLPALNPIGQASTALSRPWLGTHG